MLASRAVSCSVRPVSVPHCKGALQPRRAAIKAASSQPKSSPANISYEHYMVCVMDANPYLATHSQQAVATAAQLAARDKGRVTVLVVEEPGTTAKEPGVQADTITWHLKDRGCEDFSIITRSTTEPASVMIGDVADEVNADMVLVPSEAVHSKFVDANQLAEFVSCALLVLP